MLDTAMSGPEENAHAVHEVTIRPDGADGRSTRNGGAEPSSLQTYAHRRDCKLGIMAVIVAAPAIDAGSIACTRYLEPLAG
jgi:hypothetical protein